MKTDKTKDELFLELTKAIRANQTANQKLDDAVCRALGLNMTDARCFDILDQHGPMTAGHLATAAGLTSGAITAVIDRLAAKGFAERTNDPDDRRRVMVVATAEGLAKAHAFYMPMGEKASAAISHLKPEEIELLIDFHRRVTVIQEEAANEIAESLRT